jgi:DNA helicase HerA-like ATPase
MDSLLLSPVGMNYLHSLCQSIVSGGEVASIPSVLRRSEERQFRSQSSKALQNRLLPLVNKGGAVFYCERGLDLDKFFSRSSILNLKDVSGLIRRLIVNDQYFWLTRTQEALTTWHLRKVFIIHEAREILSRPSEFLLNAVAQARNFGIGFVFATQTPQVIDPIVRSNIGTKILFRLEDFESVAPFRAAFNLNQEQVNFVLNMPNRTMLVRRPDIPYPFLVRVPDLV